MKFLDDLDYQNVDKCIEQLSNYDFSNIKNEFVIEETSKDNTINNNDNNNNNKVFFHVYWHGTITRKQIASINSYLKTQDLDTTELWVWLDYLTYSTEIQKIPTHNTIKVMAYNPVVEADETLFKGKQFINHIKYIKFRSDIARLMILYKYGGLYFDLDMLLLRDMKPLLHLEFCYTWSYLKAGNNAILRFSKGSHRLIKLMHRYYQFLEPYNSGFNFNVSMTHTHLYNESLDILCLPCAMFDPVWALFDSKTKSKYSKLNNFDDFFKETDEDISKFFNNQIYAYHWHSRNDYIIEKDSYFEKIEKI